MVGDKNRQKQPRGEQRTARRRGDSFVQKGEQIVNTTREDSHGQTDRETDRQTDGVTMVKISFQSVAGQKVEKENDGDKTEILIPHPMVSKGSCASVITAGCHRRRGSSAFRWPAGQLAPARGGEGAVTASPFTCNQNMHILVFFVSLCTSY